MQGKKSFQLTWGLFHARGRYWYRNLTDLRILFRRIIYLLKHGRVPQANWETYTWCIDIMRDILDTYISHHTGYPARMSEDEYLTILKNMRELLSQMDETNPDYEDLEQSVVNEKRDAAKDEFFT